MARRRRRELPQLLQHIADVVGMTRFEEVAKAQHVDEADDAGFVSLTWHACSDLRRVHVARLPFTGSRLLDRMQRFGDGAELLCIFCTIRKPTIPSIHYSVSK
jgi:hypothetical protein